MSASQWIAGLVLASSLIASPAVTLAQGYQRGWQPAGELAGQHYSARFGGATHATLRQPPLPADQYLSADEGCCDAPCGGCHPGDPCGACDACCCDPCAIACGNWFAVGEMTLFRYHRADGVRVGDDPFAGENVEFDFEIAPRVTLGYAGADGFGFRVRWWEYDHRETARDQQSHLAVDTYTIDAEVFDIVQLNCNWMLQISGGVRWNEFEELAFDVPEDALRINRFHGAGGLLGMEVRRCLSPCSALFMGARMAILMDDKQVINTGTPVDVRLRDSVQGMLELSLGYEVSCDLGCNTICFARVAGEWQNWFNYSSAYSPIDNEAAFGGASDVGFGGVSISLGLTH